MKTSFEDNQGRTWHLKINIKHYMSFKDQGLVDLATIFDDNNFMSGLLDQSDMLGFLGILHELCESQYEANGVTDEMGLFEALDGDHVEQAAEAFIGAVVAFSPAHRRNALLEGYKTIKMGLTEAGEKAADHLADSREATLAKVGRNLERSMKGS